MDLTASFPEGALAAMRSEGLLGLLVPLDYGGLGGTFADMVDVGLALGRADLSTALIFTMHCQQVAALAGHAGPRLREELLPRIARGELYLASVTTEQGKGGRLLSADDQLRDGDGCLELDRDAPVVTGAAHADAFLVTMRAVDAATPSQVSLVYAERGQVTVSTTGDWQPMGMRASESLPIRLAGRLPYDHVIGMPGGFRESAVNLLAPLAHLGWSACWLGAASGALSRTIGYLRSPDGRSSHDTSSDLLLARLGRLRGRLELVHSLLRRSQHTVLALGGDLSAPPLQLQLNALKTEASEQCFAAVDELVGTVGLRHGYLRDSPLWLERAFRDLRAAALNYSNDRLLVSSGRLALLDPEVRLA